MHQKQLNSFFEYWEWLFNGQLIVSLGNNLF